MVTASFMTKGQYTCVPESFDFLDDAEHQLRTGATAIALEGIFDVALSQCLAQPETWNANSREYLKHSVHDLLCQDPMTSRAFTKPRGYAGDAVMMDYLYGLGDTAAALARTTSLGRDIYEFIAARPAASGVRWRREHLAQTIDSIAASKHGARVLAIACGHLREAAICESLRTGKVHEFLALDGDATSVNEVNTRYGDLGVTARQATVRQILARKAGVTGQYDFVYAAGLYDYLNAPVARALTARMLDACAPGGTVLIPNFLPEVADRGYMESVMDWYLIYRDQAAMREIVAGLPEARGCAVDCYDDPHGAVTYLRIRKPR